MQRLEQALANLIGAKPAYVRPPYLDTGGNFLPTISSLGYTAVTDDVDAQDWNGASPQQSEQYFQNAGAYGQGHIPLMHEVRRAVTNQSCIMDANCYLQTYYDTVHTLTPWLINWAKSNNLQLVTVAECLGGNAYQQTGLTGNGQNSC